MLSIARFHLQTFSNMKLHDLNHLVKIMNVGAPIPNPSKDRIDAITNHLQGDDRFTKDPILWFQWFTQASSERVNRGLGLMSGTTILLPDEPSKPSTPRIEAFATVPALDNLALKAPDPHKPSEAYFRMADLRTKIPYPPKKSDPPETPIPLTGRAPLSVSLADTRERYPAFGIEDKDFDLVEDLLRRGMQFIHGTYNEKKPIIGLSMEVFLSYHEGRPVRLRLTKQE